MTAGKLAPQEEIQKAGEIENAGVAKRGMHMTFISITGNADLAVLFMAALPLAGSR